MSANVKKIRVWMGFNLATVSSRKEKLDDGWVVGGGVGLVTYYIKLLAQNRTISVSNTKPFVGLCILFFR